MLRVIDVVERNVVDSSVPPVVVPAKTSTIILPDDRQTLSDEIAYLEIFNAGNDNLYVAYGGPASLTQAVCYVQPGQMYEVKTRQQLSGYSTNGTTVFITKLRRVQALSNNL